MEIWKNIFAAAPLGVLVLLPGAVWLRCEGKFSVPAKLAATERLVSYLLYSVVSYAAVYLVFSAEVNRMVEYQETGISALFKLGGSLLLVGLVGGVLTGIARHYDLIGMALAKVGIQTIHPTDTGWICAFSKKHGCLVRLTFCDGTERYGMFGAKSLASCQGDDCDDLFLEYTFRETKDGDLVPEEGSLGIWVSRQELSCVRFYDHLRLESEDVKTIARKQRRTFDWIGGPAPIADQESSPAVVDSCEEDRGQGCKSGDNAGEAVRDDCEPVESVQVKSPSGDGDLKRPVILQMSG